MRFDYVFVFIKENMNFVCGPEYAITTKNAMAQLSERETSFELIEVRFDSNAMLFVIYLFIWVYLLLFFLI